MQKLESKWTHTLNFHLLVAGAFAFAVVAALLFRDHKWNEMLVAVAMVIFFMITVALITFKRNLKMVYSEQHIELLRFPYVAAKKWTWADVKSIEIGDDFFDDSIDRAGEALYVCDASGNKVLLAYRTGGRTELRQVASDIRRHINAAS